MLALSIFPFEFLGKFFKIFISGGIIYKDKWSSKFFLISDSFLIFVKEITATR